MKNGKTLRLSEFRGVDFSNSPLKVKKTRASDAVNFYLDDEGRMRKRPGWRELLHICDDTGEPLSINGVFEYKNGEHRDVIVHAGRRFFRLKTDANGRATAEDITSSGTHEISKVDESCLADERSQAFSMAQRLYIIGCGDYLVYGSWDEGQTFELRRVYEGEDTYIPTTTVGIDADVTDYYGYDVSGSREALEDVNLLTRWRKNKLQGLKSIQQSNGSNKVYNSYTLDATIDEDSYVEVVNELTGERYVSRMSDTNGLYDLENVVDSEKIGGTVNKNDGRIFLVESCFPLDNGDSVITVLFRHTPTTEEGGVEIKDFVPYDKRVGQCRFGTIYGIDGNADRLFLAGNPNFDNVEFFSQYDDATYFSDLSTIAVGYRGQAIVGYARLSDNVMAVFKEGGGGKDASVFYHTGYYKQETDENGNILSIDAVFPTAAGNVGHTVESRHACADFGGDPLILARDGVFGIVMSENIKTADRYTRERSRSVNARLCKEKQLSEAVAICYGGRYYLSVNSHVYVADARTKYYADKDADGSYQYEWWYWEDVPARILCEMDGALCFGTQDGRLCVFDEHRCDRIHTDIEAGELTVDIPNNQLDCSASLSVYDGERIVIDTDDLYALYIDNITRIEGKRIFVDEGCILGVSDGTIVFADGEELEIGTPYVVDDVDAGSCSFCLLDTKGEAVEPNSKDFRLHLLLTGRELVVCDATATGFRVKLWDGGSVLTLTAYNGEVPLNPEGRLLQSRSVKAYWVSGVFDLGSASHDKTLLSIGVTAEPGMNSHMSFGYVTRRDVREYDQGGTMPGKFGLKDLSFSDFSFSTGFAQSCTKRIFDRGINYIAFRVRSDEGDCALSAMEVIYKFNSYQGGVR